MKQNNPVAAALLSNMGINEKERVEVKKEFLRMLARFPAIQSRDILPLNEKPSRLSPGRFLPPSHRTLAAARGVKLVF